MNEEDITLFRQAVADVKPIKRIAKLEKATPKLKRVQHQLPPEPNWLSHTPVALVNAETPLAFQHSKNERHLKQLYSGDFSTRCVIDLHGMTEVAAQEALNHMLHRCRHRRDRFALIVHGKGLNTGHDQPILKNFINWWLRQHPRVLAFCSAKPEDGGEGAVYVLLAPAQ